MRYPVVARRFVLFFFPLGVQVRSGPFLWHSPRSLGGFDGFASCWVAHGANLWWSGVVVGREPAVPGRDSSRETSIFCGVAIVQQLGG